MFEGFELENIHTGEATLRVRHGGSGPPLLVLHGHPQTHVMWHKIAPRLAEDFTVICPDLRGYGGSSKPPTTPDHEPYSKRAMARDMVALMRGFGFEEFSLVGHDRGGRVAYRLALDHPQHVQRLAVLDIVPTAEMWRKADKEFGLTDWHWFFLAQPYPFPERIIRQSPENFYFPNRGKFDPEALEDYLRAVRNPATVHAMCEDYRAGATFDHALDEADRGHRYICCLLLVLWAGKDELGRWFDVPEVWRGWADDVQGQAVDSGHFLAEEAPDETYGALQAFLTNKPQHARTTGD